MAASAVVQEQVLDEKLTELEKARQWSPRVISKLETFIRTADDYDLFRVNPIRYAADRGMAEQEAIDLFLYAVKFGLLEMEWHIICASCGHIVQSLRNMARLHSRFTCSCCSMLNEAALDDFIQVAFTISRTVREIRYHTPSSLAPRDFIQNYSFSRLVASPYFAGESYAEFFEKQHRFIGYIEPGTTAVAEFESAPGPLVGIDLAHETGFTVLVGEEPAPPGGQRFRVQLVNGKALGVDPLLVPQAFSLGDQSFAFESSAFAGIGPIQIEMENTMTERSPMLIMQIPATEEGVPHIRFEAFLSGKRLLNNQTFRDLFRSEVVQSDEGLGVRDITFMFTDLKGSTMLYDQIGDAKAYYLVRQHFDTLGRVIVQNEGAVVKTIGDAVMATFVNPKAAVAAALGMLEEIEKFNAGISEKLILKIGIHRGHSIVVTLNDRLDYFGQTVNIASRVQNLADASEIVITDQVRESPGVQELVKEGSFSQAEETMLKGIGEKMRVYRIKMG